MDDVIVYRRTGDRFLVVVNAGNHEKDWRWLQGQSPRDCELRDRSDDYALLALQGPRAQAILQPLTAIDLAQLAYYHFAEGEVDGHPVLVARTGYTGEDGFELFVAPDRAEALWRRLLEAGSREAGSCPPASARATPCAWKRRCASTGTTWTRRRRSWRRGSAGSSPSTRASSTAGACSRNRRRTVRPASSSASRWWGGASRATATRCSWATTEVGPVTSGSYAPFLQKNIGLVYLPAAHAVPGTEFDVDIRGKRVAARVVPTPFYKRQK